MSSNAVTDVARAHADGELFAHMFEFYPEAMAEELPALCGVLNNDKGSRFENVYRRNITPSPEGYEGLATTALKKGLPVRIWDMFSGVGLLFDGKAVNDVKPLHVSSRDSLSRVENGQLKISGNDSAQFADLAHMQGCVTEHEKGADYLLIDLSTRSATPPPDQPAGVPWREQVAKARAALPVMWKTIESMPWDTYIKDHMGDSQGMNEVNVAAHLRGAKGIIVSENIRGIEVVRQGSDEIERLARFAERVKNAQNVRKFMTEKYGEQFNEQNLPIFSYDPYRAEGQLVALSEKQLLEPKKFFEERHRSDTHRVL